MGLWKSGSMGESWRGGSMGESGWGGSMGGLVGGSIWERVGGVREGGVNM